MTEITVEIIENGDNATALTPEAAMLAAWTMGRDGDRTYYEQRTARFIVDGREVGRMRV